MIESVNRAIDAVGSVRAYTLCVLLLLANWSPLWAQGYRLSPPRDPEQVIVDRQGHWQAWEMPSHLVSLDRGTVRARDFRAVHELLSDRTFGRPVELTSDESRISNMDSTIRRDLDGRMIRAGNEFVYDYFVRPGVSRAGSNPDMAQNIVDGIDTTYWEPSLDDDLEDWWIEVDLARAVPLQRLQLDFVEERLGDPYYRYIIIFGPSQLNHGPGPPSRNSETFIPFEGVNTDQRTFVFDAERLIADLPPDARASSRRLPVTDADKTNSLLQGTLEPSPEWHGKLVETIRIVITDTRGGQAEQISEEEWRALPSPDRGDIIYFLKDGDFEEPVDRATYDSLAVERQGPVAYFRRELPRLAEVKAWAPGDDIGPGILTGGAVTLTTSRSAPRNLFDGGYFSANEFDYYTPIHPEQNTLTADIGGVVWLEEARLVLQWAARGYRLRGSEGVRDARGNLQWESLSSLQRENNVANGNYRLLADVLEPARRVRFFDYVAIEPGESFGRFGPTMRMMWLFSKGPPAEVVLESDLITLPGLFSLGAVHWEAEDPPGSEVEIRTRSGDQLLQRIRYCDLVGNCDYTKSTHKRLSFTTKGPIDTSNVVGPGWSPWSRKYERQGDQVTSPGLRRFMQFQVRLINNDREAVPAISRISVDLQQPLVQRLGAEVWPGLAAAGRPDTFEVFVQPSFILQPFDSSSPGLDEILLRARPSIDLRLVDLAIGTEEELASAQPVRVFDRSGVDSAGNPVLLDSADDTLRILSQRDSPTSRLDSLWLRFPEPLKSTTDLPRAYYRFLEPGDEVPTGLGGQLLTLNSHNRLPKAEIGDIRYFQKVGTRLDEIEADDYESLPEEEKGPVHYFRVVTGLGEQTVFDALGDTLARSDHNRLGGNAKGWVIGQGRLLRLRFVSAVYLPSTELEVAVRNTALDIPWQKAEGLDVTSLRPANSLAIQAEERGQTVADIDIAPNPFTPNDDQVNDEAHISFSLLSVAAPRTVTVQIYSLGGDSVRRLEHQSVGGAHVVDWDGRDDGGDLVAPGLYLCQITAAADTDAARKKHTRVIAVVY